MLLIHPTLRFPEPDAEAVRTSMAPLLGVNALASVVRACGAEPTVLDPLYYYSARLGPEESFTAMSVRLVRMLEPKLVCVSAVSHLRTEAEVIARAVKDHRPDAIVAMGGVHLTDGPRVAVRQFGDVADLLIAGPGEEALRVLIRAFRERAALEKVPGLLWKNTGADGWLARIGPGPAGAIPDAATIALPDYDQYAAVLSGGQLRRALMVTTRGCPFACRFCSAASVRGSGVWAMSPETVVDHLRHLRDRYGVREISFHDETFFYDRHRAVRIFQLMRQHVLFFDDLYLHTTVASLDETVLAAYRAAGGRRLFVGLESGSERIRKEMRKPFSRRLGNDEIIARARMCREHGIDLGVFLIVGWPGETEADRTATARLLEAIRPADLQTSVLKIYPGTAIHARAVEEGRMTEEDWLDRARAYFTYVAGDDLAAAGAFGRQMERRFQTHAIRRLFESQGDRYVDEVLAAGGSDAYLFS